MAAIEAEGLVKVYRARSGDVRALDGVDLEVREGTVLGLLGPNGAGKTTTVRILATLLRADAGRATVGGLDVVRDAQAVRRLIGLSGQYAAVDENLTGRENLWMFGRLYQLSSAEARRRAEELLSQFALEDAADRVAKTYSGGMRRRLDLAGALVGQPRLLFLDEPTTGLDPRSRLAMWEVIRRQVREGNTLLLTTQYLEEADELADEIAVVDHGRIIARGTADELKTQIGGERIEVVVHDRSLLPRAAELLAAANGQPSIDEHTKRLTIAAHGGAQQLVDVVRALGDASIALDDVGLRRPTLDDWRVHTSVGDFLAAILLMLGFTFAMAWLGVLLGLLVPTVETAQQLGFLVIFPLTFLSNAFVPTETLPNILEPVAEWNPFSALTQATRELFGNPSPFPTGSFPSEHPILVSLLWTAGLFAVFAPLAVSR